MRYCNSYSCYTDVLTAINTCYINVACLTTVCLSSVTDLFKMPLSSLSSSSSFFLITVFNGKLQVEIIIVINITYHHRKHWSQPDSAWYPTFPSLGFWCCYRNHRAADISHSGYKSPFPVLTSKNSFLMKQVSKWLYFYTLKLRDKEIGGIQLRIFYVHISHIVL